MEIHPEDLDIDPNLWMEWMKDTFYNLIRVPYQLWASSPAWFKGSVGVFFVCLAVVIVVWYYYNKDEWLRVEY